MQVNSQLITIEINIILGFIGFGDHYLNVGDVKRRKK